MTDPSSKSPSIPSWQQMKPSDKVGSQRPDTKTQSSSSTSQSALLEHAERFLQDESTRDSTIEKKTSFLRSKALTEEQIHKLLRENEGIVAETSTSSAVDASRLKTVHDSTATNPHSKMSTHSSNTLSTSPTSETQNRDVPPIITYPEFMLQSQKPPPLITAQRLLYVIYGISAITATAYGTSKYIVEPMLESLAQSRHDLFSSTLTHLDKLNQKLEANVSSVPPLPSPSKRPHDRHAPYKDDFEVGDDDAATSIASDPTELFHRDIATQTTPSLPHSPSATSPLNAPSSRTSSLDDNYQGKSDRLTTTHTSRLNTLRLNLSSLLSTEDPSSTSNTTPTNDNLKATKDGVSDLQNYLDTLTYSSGSVTYDFSSTSVSDRNQADSQEDQDLTTAGAGSRRRAGASGIPGRTTQAIPEEDETTKVKQEIRALKGALLSSRNFPMGNALGGRMPREGDRSRVR